MKITDEWEEFTGGPSQRKDTRIHVTLNRNNSLIINRNTYRLLGSPEAVIFHFSRKQQKILVTSTHRRNAKGFPVVPVGSGGCRIQVTPFIRAHGIRVDKTEKFTSAEVDGDGMLILDLQNT